MYAFDVQEDAVSRTRERLAAGGPSRPAQSLHCAGHERIPEFVKEPVDAAVFNLGWLPGGDKAVTTRVENHDRGAQRMPRAPQAPGAHHRVRLPRTPGGRGRALRGERLGRRRCRIGYQAMVRAFLNPARPAPALFAVQRIR